MITGSMLSQQNNAAGSGTEAPGATGSRVPAADDIAGSEFGDSSVNLVCRPWAATPDYWNVEDDLTEGVKLAFDETGISIPFPQRDVHGPQVPAPAA